MRVESIIWDEYQDKYWMLIDPGPGIETQLVLIPEENAKHLIQCPHRIFKGRAGTHFIFIQP